MLKQPNQSSILTEPSKRYVSPLKPKPNVGPQRTHARGLTQAYEFREIASMHALELKDTPAGNLEELATRAQALRNLANVWSLASDRIRILRGRPLPGSLRPEPKKPKRVSTRAIPSEDPPTPSTPC